MENMAMNNVTHRKEKKRFNSNIVLQVEKFFWHVGEGNEIFYLVSTPKDGFDPKDNQY